MTDLRDCTVSQLLRLHAGIADELRRRELLRSGNGPAGDYAEALFARAFGWNLSANSTTGYDAVDSQGIRYQIKCRRVTVRNPSRQLSALRRLDQRPFDQLAGLILDERFDVHRAAIIPLETIIAGSTFTPHVNAWRFILRDAARNLPGTRDVTGEMKAAPAAL
ncbi:hypothetical protein FHS55_000451 [Angulomicrobium tetraedrale]|uniref:Uncharacterized protein n=1 Tax=Ancylobacter tetraedralis TaxID=217068 RepID=A0A839Z757_9HYPH|nr:hypothetical protein [Ancylobacter tetraedralis]MBB3769865.1 hypothetical protein [Ancylobacter tetraedralis]